MDEIALVPDENGCKGNSPYKQCFSWTARDIKVDTELGPMTPNNQPMSEDHFYINRDDLTFQGYRVQRGNSSVTNVKGTCKIIEKSKKNIL